MKGMHLGKWHAHGVAGHGAEMIDETGEAVDGIPKRAFSVSSFSLSVIGSAVS